LLTRCGRVLRVLSRELGGHRDVQAVMVLLERLQAAAGAADDDAPRSTAAAFRADLPRTTLTTAAQAGTAPGCT
jgi:hypothetical protein